MDYDFSTKLGIAKAVVRFTAVSGTYKIINNIIKSHTHPETIAEHVQIIAGSFAIAGIVADQVGPYTDKQVDEAIKLYHQVRNAIQENKTEEPVAQPQSP